MGGEGVGVVEGGRAGLVVESSSLPCLPGMVTNSMPSSGVVSCSLVRGMGAVVR